MCDYNYNEVPHEKIVSLPMNIGLVSLIKIGHEKEKTVTIDVFNKAYNEGLNPLTDVLATISDGDLSRVLTHIIKETKLKKSKIEKHK